MQIYIAIYFTLLRRIVRF